MIWSLRLLTVSGIAIRVHVTFLLVVGYFAVVGQRHGWAGAAFGALLAILLFTCVVLHELGHSLVAQRLGVPVREIVLLPIGGVARLAREPRTPLHELLIAVAGPLVNVVLALALGAVVFLNAGVPGLIDSLGAIDPRRPPSAWSMVESLLVANVTLAVFNMLPALPMDGGRVLRALLSMVAGARRGTRWAAMLGQVLALAMAGIGIATRQLGLTLVGAFVFLGAGQERSASVAADLLGDFRAGEICDPAVEPLSWDDSLGVALDRWLREAVPALPIMRGGAVVGALLRDDVTAAVRRLGMQAPVVMAARGPLVEVPPSATLTELRDKLTEADGVPVAVVGTEGFVGLLSIDDLRRVALLAAELERVGIRRPGQSPAA